MQLPARLIRTKISRRDLKTLTGLLNALSALIDNEGKNADDHEIIRLMDEWNAIACRPFEFHEFRDFNSWTDARTFIKTAFNHQTYISDLTFTEAVAVAEYIISADGDEADQNYALDLLDINFPEAGVSDLIYWPDAWFENDDLPDVDLSAEEIIAYLAAKSGRRPENMPDIPLPYPLPE